MNPGDDPRPIGDYVDAAFRELNRPKLVHLDRDDTLTFRAAPEYELDAREFDTKSGLLRWLWHLTVSGKRGLPRGLAGNAHRAGRPPPRWHDPETAQVTPLEIAKDKVTIPQLWDLRGWPGKPGRSCRVPYRPDHAPSGSVLADGKLFHDFTTGENFDAPALLARVEELTNEAACRLFLTLAGVDSRDVREVPSARIVARAAAPPDAARAKPKLPTLRVPS